MVKLLIAFLIAYLAVRVLRFVLAVMVEKRVADEKLTPKKTDSALELMACPHCGVYTAFPCTNPDCPGN